MVLRVSAATQSATRVPSVRRRLPGASPALLGFVGSSIQWDVRVFRKVCCGSYSSQWVVFFVVVIVIIRHPMWV